MSRLHLECPVLRIRHLRPPRFQVLEPPRRIEPVRLGYRFAQVPVVSDERIDRRRYLNGDRGPEE
jgi:hypothetical protein